MGAVFLGYELRGATSLACSGSVMTRGKPGGPRQGDTPMTEVIKIRITAEMSDRLYRAALKSGKSLAAYVRDRFDVVVPNH